MEEIKKEFAATVYVIKDGKVLLNFHQFLKKFIPLGGHIEANELPCDAAIREAKEESGLDIKLINPPDREIKNFSLCQNFNIKLDIIKPDHHHINLAYLGRVTGGKQLERSDQNTELKWFSPEEIKNSLEIFKDTKELALKAIEIMEKISD